MGEKKYYRSISVGITRVVAKITALYLALGLGWLDTYREYYDEFEILGKHGDYFIKDNSEMYFSLNCGSIFMIGKRANMNIGFDVLPAGINLGIAYMFS